MIRDVGRTWLDEGRSGSILVVEAQRWRIAEYGRVGLQRVLPTLVVLLQLGTTRVLFLDGESNLGGLVGTCKGIASSRWRW